MVQTMILLCLIGFGVLILGTDAQSWSCVAAEQCALSLERDFNEAIGNKNDSHVIDFCLKKTKEFRTVCLLDAVITCEWGGNEAEYYRLQDIQKSFQRKCSELCPVMEEIKVCSGLVNYNLYITKKFQDFCNSYKESVKCKDNVLTVDTNCTFGEKLYMQDFEADTLRVFNSICNSGCEDIDTAWAVLERCTGLHNLNNAGSGCKTYQDLEKCLSVSKSCPQIHMMAPYFARNYTEYMMRCPLPMPVNPVTPAPTVSQEQETTVDSKKEKETTMDSETVKNLTPNQYLPMETTMSKDNVQSSSSTESSTEPGVSKCLPSLNSPLFSTDIDYCESVRCLRNIGLVSKDVLSIHISKSMEQQLLAKWDSCEGEDESKNDTFAKYTPLSVTAEKRSPVMSSTDVPSYTAEKRSPVMSSTDVPSYTAEKRSQIMSSTYAPSYTHKSKTSMVLQDKNSTETFLSSNSISTSKMAKMSEKVIPVMENATDLNSDLRSSSPSTHSPVSSGLRGTEWLFPELSDEKNVSTLRYESQIDSSTSGRITDRNTTNHILHVTSVRNLNKTSLSSLEYESATPSLELKTQRMSTPSGKDKLVLSEDQNNGASMKIVADIVLLITTMTSSIFVG